MPRSSTVNSQNKKIAEALKVLEEAAEEQPSETQDLIDKSFPKLKEKLFGKNKKLQGSGDTPKFQISERFANAREVGEEKIKEVATKVDGQAHSNPWPFIGTIAFLSFILGLLMGHDD